MKFVKGILAAVLLLCSYGAWGYDWDFYDVNEYGDTIYYEITSSTELTCEVANRYKTTSSSGIVVLNNSYSGDIVIPETAIYNQKIYKVTGIGQHAFLDCQNVTSITIPNSVTSIGHSAFFDCISITSLTIPEGVPSIEENTFTNCRSITSFTIPKSVTSIGNDAFSDCVSLTSITSLNPEPPTCDTYTWERFDTSACKLYVPANSYNAYKAADGWKDFRYIETTGITNTTADTQVKELYRYTIDGKRIDAPQKGINIIKYSDGTAKKVLILLTK